MWQIEADSPLSHGGAWVRDENGSNIWCVATKACFSIEEGILASRTQPSIQQEQHSESPPSDPRTEVVTVPVYDESTTDDVESKEWVLIRESDLQPFRAETDLVVEASAFSPTGAPMKSFLASLMVSPRERAAPLLDLRLRITGDRRVLNRSDEPIVEAVQPIRQIPVTWHRAFGGSAVRLEISQDGSMRDVWRANPVGRGYYTPGLSRPSHDWLPNITFEDDNDVFTRRTVSLGALAPTWQPRVDLRPEYVVDAVRRDPVAKPPKDNAFYLSGSPATRLQHFLQGNERIRAINLGASGTYVFDLPGWGIQMTAHWPQRVESKVAQLTGVRMELDVSWVELVWTASWKVAHRDVEKLVRTTVERADMGELR